MTTVVQALAQVAAELPGISKGEKSPQGYAFRGIEAITKEAGPLLAKHGVVFVPQVQKCEVREITVNGKPWTDTILTVRYRIHGPSTTKADDYIEATVVGIGRDNSDKGANKALTQAFKYALIQTLCIADAKDDGDSDTHEADAPPDPATLPAPKGRIELIAATVAFLNPEQAEKFGAWKADQGFPWPWTNAACDAIDAELKRMSEEPFK